MSGIIERNKGFLIACGVAILAAFYFSGGYTPPPPAPGQRPGDPPGPIRLSSSEREKLNTRLQERFGALPPNDRPIWTELTGILGMYRAFDYRHDRAWWLLKYVHPKTQHVIFHTASYASFNFFVGIDSQPKILVELYRVQPRMSGLSIQAQIEDYSHEPIPMTVRKLENGIFLLDDVSNPRPTERITFSFYNGVKHATIPLDEGLHHRKPFFEMVYGKPLAADWH